MSAQKAAAPVRFARFVAAAALLALTVTLGVRLAGRREAPRPPAVEPLPEGRIVDLKERVRHEEYREGRLVAEVRGDTFFIGQDGRNHLRGSVEVVNYGPSGEAVSKLTADEVVYDKGALLFAVTGRVRVEAGGAILEGDSFDYDKTSGLFRTTAGGVFAAKTMTGRATEVSFLESADEVRLAGGFRIEIAAAGRTGGPTALSGDSFIYRRAERSGRAEGRAELACGPCRGEARTIAFTAAADESGIVSAMFDGEARFVTGGTSVTAPTAALQFDEAGALRQWTASGGFRAEIGAGEGRGPTVLEGDTAAFDAAEGILAASGNPAVADSTEARVEASSLSAGPADDDLSASGGVACLLKAGEKSRTAGLFSAGRAVYVTADRLAFRAGPGTAAFSGNVRLSQDADSLIAGEIEISEAAAELRGRGGVTAALTCPVTKAAPDGRVELGGEEVVFSASGRTLAFKGKSRIRLAGAQLDAATVTAVLGGEGTVVESLEARTGVVLARGRYEGRAAAAEYQAATDRIVLTGKPVLTDKEGGSARGDKLTFDLADDKILIENEGQGRSTTVVRS